MGALYLLDETGHPFKRATLEEADGLPVITGVDARAVRRAEGRERGGVPRGAGAAGRATARGAGRPALSEVNIDPRFGFSLVLLDGAGEVRLGRGGIAKSWRASIRSSRL